TGDLRDSPAVAVAQQLCRHGVTVVAHDPCVPAGTPGLDPVQVVDDPYLVAEDASVLVVLTEWPEFLSLNWPRLEAETARAVIVDTRNLLDETALGHTGFRIIGIGTGEPGPHA